MNEQGITERCVLYDSRYVKTGVEPPEYVIEALAQVFPMVRLDWHPFLKRWTLWEINGRELTLIAALAGPKGEYVTPNLHNTIGLLERCLVRGRINSEHDLNKWLEALDEEPQDVKDLKTEGDAKIREGSKAFWDLLKGKSQVQVG